MAKHINRASSYRSRALPTGGRMIFLTRDRDEDGALDDMIDIWSEEPERVDKDNGAVIWRAKRTRVNTLLKILHVGDTRTAFGIAPTHAKEMIILARRSKAAKDVGIN